MGVKFSLPLANLYMGWWERSCIFGGENPFRPHMRIYLRYIDDLLLVAVDGVDMLNPLLE